MALRRPENKKFSDFVKIYRGEKEINSTAFQGH